MVAMAKSFTQIQAQIKTLQRQADQLKADEIKGVVARIREAIAAYGLTAADLGLAGGARRGRKQATKVAARTRRSASGKARGVKFRDASGNTWGGRGPRPQWLRDALAKGKSLEDFLVKPGSDAAT